MPERVDLNADMGESYGRWTLGDDGALMPHLTSANIACGFHGGDPHVMRRTVALALEHGVVYQAGALRAFVEAAGGRLQHVKPHGALYTSIVDSAEHAHAVARAVAAVGPE